KEEKFKWEKAKVSEALTPDQAAILEERGYLSPDQIHRLATKKGNKDGQKLDCHSDLIQGEKARKVNESVISEA
ncbi:MAG: hypothetical protein MI702_13890, partial [Chlorobiales bacterium]|nr:hypothetical protein [Chlorobiales bacterium]